jgi:hypothetical protein
MPETHYMGVRGTKRHRDDLIKFTVLRVLSRIVPGISNLETSIGQAARLLLLLRWLVPLVIIALILLAAILINFVF